MTSRNSITRVLVIQRNSLSDENLLSRSIGARFTPLLNYMSGRKLISFCEILEDNITLMDLKSCDVVLFNKHSSRQAINIMKMSHDIGLKTIYDLDDWILDLPEYSVTDLLEDQLGNIIWMIRNATFVTVSCNALMDKVALLRNPIFLLKNGIDPSAFGFGDGGWSESKKPKILFSNTDGIKLIKFKEKFFELIINFLNDNPEISIDYWGDIFPEIYQIPRIRIRGFLHNEAYKRAILSEGYWFSIVPLGGPEDADSLFFNSCKSCIKYIDYGALGIPGIYSNTPVYTEVVKHQVNGILVDNDSLSWEKAMNSLLQNSLLRREIRESAYVDVVKNHGLKEPAKIFLNLLRL
ncbi:glycosyltransferase [Polynucleobacter sp. UK-Mo-2m-Kol15]|uniref:glycosyltransferase n=1 Tax=Polynucleobacter sp. UK-Mo-2m-Kol15 TaxID=2576916 RepID=UPI001C0AD4E2|nr:glycosyltransferase [Polynucleobacter sp. UK-Mo-2m-Kol15]MBU3574780.1 glycosyltransferase [Polynucleobacter sp. UK-Mo-2m-Kol15]